MDTLGVCGASSTAGDNGVVMVKEPRLGRESEPPPQTLTILKDVSEWTDGWTPGMRVMGGVFPKGTFLNV